MEETPTLTLRFRRLEGWGIAKGAQEEEGERMDLKAIMKNSLHFGIGAISSTREKVEEMVSELVKKGELSKKEGKHFAEEITGSIDKARKEIDNQIQKGTKKAAEALNLVTMDDMKKLDRKIARLRSDLKKLSGEAAGKKKKGK